MDGKQKSWKEARKKNEKKWKKDLNATPICATLRP
jgi:hypothetical protein